MTDATGLKRDLWKKMAQSPYVMIGLTGSDQHSEPLTAQLDEDQIDTLWFFAGKGNRLASGGKAMAQFVSKGHDLFACLSGSVRIVEDPMMVGKLWSPQVEAWFPGGRADPNLILLRFDIDDAELWETDMSIAGKLKLVFGGPIEASEEGSHERIATTAV